MKKNCRILVVLLSLVMLFMAACGDNPTNTTPAGDNAGNALELVVGDQTEYKIVYAAKGESWERTAATRLKNAIKSVTGVNIPVVKDTDGTVDPNAKEIIIATPKNNRASTYTAKGGMNLGYNLYVDGNRLIIEAGSKTGAFFATAKIIKDHFGYDLEAGELSRKAEDFEVFRIAANYASSRVLNSAEFPYLGIPLTDLEIAYNGDSYIQKCFAMEIRSEIEFMLGADLLLWDIAYGAEEGQAYITFEQDDELQKGKWEIRPHEEGIIIAANGYYGFEAAMTAFVKAKNGEGYFDLAPNDVLGGDYLDTIGRAEYNQSHKYAYNNLGEYRVMLYNALFWDSADGNYFPAQERNRVQVEMIAEYMPDVLGLQEFNISKRSGLYAMPKLLEELGYVETVDPIVNNTGNTDYWLGGAVYDSDGNLIGYKPGKGNRPGYEIDASKYGFETTYYNHTPLFYNTATTKYITGAYYWYENQWDLGELVTDEYGTYYPSTHENSAGDAGSKSLTWGLFESLETGEQYIVISTHMCTRSDYIRGLQAQEVVALVDELEATYGCPVIFGGDMNGNGKRNSANYTLFMGDAGYTSMQDHGVAEVYTSMLLSSHGYPDHNGTILTTGGAPSVCNVGDSIDHIFFTNYDPEVVSVKVYGIIADMCSLRGSDHLPLFVDFSISSKNG